MIWGVDCLLAGQSNEKSVADARFIERYNKDEATEQEHSDQHTANRLAPPSPRHQALTCLGLPRVNSNVQLGQIFEF